MVITLKLFIDEEKQKVVFAEAVKDFVDILFSFLTLSMGSIVGLTEKHHKSESIAIGCFRNIYASVADMGIEHFRTEACKYMLLCPRSLNQENETLKLGHWDNDVGFFVCPNFESNEECGKRYSIINTTRCCCGKRMSELICIDEEEGRVSRVNFHTSFIITDDLKVKVISAGYALDVLRVFGYANCEKLVQKTHNVNRQEFVTLLESLFDSDSALTDTFLKMSNSYGVKNIQTTRSLAVQEDRKESKDDQMIKLNAYVNKKEWKIEYVECGVDFVDLLFSFLAMPLGSIGESSSNRIMANFCRSVKDLGHDEREAKYGLPYDYKCQKQLLVTTPKPPTYYRYVSRRSLNRNIYRFSENSGKKPVYSWDELVPMIWIDPKSEGDSNTVDETTTPSGGFLKGGMKFMVTDDLIITLSSLSSAFGLLKEKQIQCDDVEVQAIIIRKEEALRLLQASLETSSALSTALLPIIDKADFIRGQQLILEKQFATWKY